MEGVLRKVEALPVETKKQPVDALVATESNLTPTERLRARYDSLISKQPTPIECSLGIISLLDSVVAIASDASSTYRRGQEALKDVLSSMGAEKSITDAADHLYHYSKQFLLTTLSGNGGGNNNDHVWGISTGLLLEEIGSILYWFESRSQSLSLSGDSYKLGDEGFFGLSIEHDIERAGRFGILFSGGMNLDSRGSEDLWLSIKLINRSTQVYEAKERPLGTKGERKIGRIIIDRFEQFIPYENIDWPLDVSGKVSKLTVVASVINRKGDPCFTSRIIETCRILKDPIANAFAEEKSFSSFWSHSLLKGHRLENIKVQKESDELSISADCSVIACADRNVVFAARVLDLEGNLIFDSEYALQCVTNIARFYDVGVLVTDLSVVQRAASIEILVLDENQKTLCSERVGLKS